jgi:hypothetical protein
MVVQVGNGALSGDNSLDEEPEHGEHGESAQRRKGGLIEARGQEEGPGNGMRKFS